MPPKEPPSSSQKSKGSTKTPAKSGAAAAARKTPSKSAAKRPHSDVDALSDDELSQAGSATPARGPTPAPSRVSSLFFILNTRFPYMFLLYVSWFYLTHSSGTRSYSYLMSFFVWTNHVLFS
jgi:hypothetical protein